MVPWAHASQPPPNGISIGSAIFAQLTNVTNWWTHRQTHRQTYVVCLSVCDCWLYGCAVYKQLNRSRCRLGGWPL